MSKSKKYLIVTIILSGLFAIAVLTAVITRPKNLNVDTSQYEMVTAKVLEVKKPFVFWRYQRHTSYTVIVEYQGKEYKMGPLAGAPYAEGANYEFCLLNGKFYPTAKDAEAILENQVMNPLYKVSMPGAFFLFIAWIYFFVAYMQNRKNSNNKIEETPSERTK